MTTTHLHAKPTATRRAILALGAGMMLLAPLRRANAIEPMTYLQAAAAVVGIVTGIMGAKNDTQVRGLLNSISNKLDTVLANQVVILQEIAALRLFFTDALLASWREAYGRSINAQHDRLKVYIADYLAEKHLPKDLEDDFRTLSSDCLQSTTEIGQLDVGAFPFFGTGVATVLTCERVLKANAARIAELKATFRKYLDHWLDPANPRSIVGCMAKLEREAAAIKADLEQRGRTHLLSESQRHNSDGDVWCTERVRVWLTVSGDLQSGFGGSVRTEIDNKKCKPVRPDRPCRACIELVGSEGIDALMARRSPKGFWTTGLTDSDIPVVPGFTPSGYEIVDQFNRGRVAYFELLAALVRQQIVKQQMEALRNQLK